MSAARGSRKRRPQIMLDEDQYRGLAEEARIAGRSVSSLVCEAIDQWLAPRRPRPIQETSFWSLVGKGHSGQTGEKPISESVDYFLYVEPDEKAHPRNPGLK